MESRKGQENEDVMQAIAESLQYQSDALAEKEREEEEVKQAIAASLEDLSVGTVPPVDKHDRHIGALTKQNSGMFHCEMSECLEAHSHSGGIFIKQMSVVGSCVSFNKSYQCSKSSSSIIPPIDDPSIRGLEAAAIDKLTEEHYEHETERDDVPIQNRSDKSRLFIESHEKMDPGRFRGHAYTKVDQPDESRHTVVQNDEEICSLAGTVETTNSLSCASHDMNYTVVINGVRVTLCVGHITRQKMYDTSTDARHTHLTVTDVTPDCVFSCKYILHVKQLKPGQTYLQQSIDGAMKDIADVCEQQGITSLALPPLGVSKEYGYAADDVATQMIQGIGRHLNFLQELKLVVHETDMKVHITFRAKLESYDVGGPQVSPKRQESIGVPQVREISGTRPKQYRQHPQYRQALGQTANTSWIMSWFTRIGRSLGDREAYKKSFPRSRSITKRSREKIRQIIADTGVKCKPGKDSFILMGNQMSVDHAFAEITEELQKRNKDDLKKPIAVKRSSDFIKCMADFDPVVPSYWTQISPGTSLKKLLTESYARNTCRKWTLKTDSDVHKIIVRMMNETFDASKLGQGNDAAGLQGYSKLWVVKVERIENVSLYEKYVMKRQELFRKLCAKSQDRCKPVGEVCMSGEALTETYRQKCRYSEFGKDMYPHVNEVYMFHGTQADNVSVICNNGLDPRLCQDNAMLGRGIYGAERAMKSDQYADDRKRRTWGKGREQKMLLIRMLLGDCFVSTTNNPPKYKRPPCKICFKDVCINSNHKESFDSVVSDCGKMFREFVVYNSDFCYPEYLITYERR